MLFRGSPVVKLRGTLVLRERPDYVAEIAAIGALEDIQVDPATGNAQGVDRDRPPRRSRRRAASRSS